MRVNRAKAVRKHLMFFRIVYGFDKAIFHVILDGNFIFAAIKYKVDIKERLDSLLQGADVKIYVLRSVLDELKQVGAKAAGALEFAKSFCEPLDDSAFRGESVSDRTIAMMRQQHDDWLSAPGKRKRRFMVATQDRELRTALGRVPGIPLVYLNKVIMVLEPPSSSSKDFNQQVESHKVALKPTEAAAVERVGKRKRGGESVSIIGIAGGGDGRDEIGGSGSDSDADSEGASDKQTVGERRKHKALAANPLSSKLPSTHSHKQKKRKKDKFSR